MLDTITYLYRNAVQVGAGVEVFDQYQIGANCIFCEYCRRQNVQQKSDEYGKSFHHESRDFIGSTTASFRTTIRGS